MLRKRLRDLSFDFVLFDESLVQGVKYAHLVINSSDIFISHVKNTTNRIHIIP